MLGFLESADSGKIWVDGQDVTNLAEEELRRFRDRAFGFLFQNPYLLPSFSVAQNVAIPLFRIRRSNAIAARERTIQVLDFCGIADLENQRAGSLVLSAQRRVAFARALVHDPRVLVSLSPHAGDDLFELAFRAAEELKLCVLWAGAEAGVPEGHAGSSGSVTDASARTNGYKRSELATASRAGARKSISRPLWPACPRIEDGMLWYFMIFAELSMT